MRPTIWRGERQRQPMYLIMSREVSSIPSHIYVSAPLRTWFEFKDLFVVLWARIDRCYTPQRCGGGGGWWGILFRGKLSINSCDLLLNHLAWKLYVSCDLRQNKRIDSTPRTRGQCWILFRWTVWATLRAKQLQCGAKSDALSLRTPREKIRQTLIFVFFFFRPTRKQSVSNTGTPTIWFTLNRRTCNERVTPKPRNYLSSNLAFDKWIPQNKRNE